jgi:hypothetical protein
LDISILDSVETARPRILEWNASRGTTRGPIRPIGAKCARYRDAVEIIVQEVRLKREVRAGYRVGCRARSGVPRKPSSRDPIRAVAYGSTASRVGAPSAI